MSTATHTLPLSVPAAIEARHSIRRYLPGPVPKADLDEILRLATYAPSSANTQPWRFVVIQDKAVQAELQAVAYNQQQVGHAPVLIVVYTDVADTLASVADLVHPGVPEERREASQDMIRGLLGRKNPAEQQLFAANQASIALGFLVLAAQALGYSTSVMGGFDAEAFKARLGLPPEATLPAIVALGVADEPGFSTHRLPLTRLVRHIP